MLSLLALAAVGSAQGIGSVAENNPVLITKQCTSAGCVEKHNFLTLDMFSRNITATSDPTKSCAAKNITNLLSVCNSAESCASTCQVQGADYDAVGLVMSSPNSFGLKLFNKNSSGALAPHGPKVFILDESGDKYTALKLNTELTFDVDLSTVPCGAVSAVVAQEMDLTGYKSALNPGGAKYGAGYCNAQCDPTLPFVNGSANVNGLGACCAEFDIFHSNSRATQASPHPCNPTGLSLCSTAAGNCKDQANPTCDRHGCWMKPYMQGAKNFYGRGRDFTVDTTRPFTVVTQFLGGPGSTWGGLKRMYIQDGKLIDNFAINGSTKPLEIEPDYCTAVMSTKTPDVLGNFTRLGGLDAVAKSLSDGMVISWSLWTSADFANWLDADENGPCNATEGDAKIILAQSPDTMVKYSDVRWGEPGTTYKDKIGSGLGR